MKKFFAAMVLAGLVAVPVTFAEDAKTETPKKEKKGKKASKKKDAEKAPETETK